MSITIVMQFFKQEICNGQRIFQIGDKGHSFCKCKASSVSNSKIWYQGW